MTQALMVALFIAKSIETINKSNSKRLCVQPSRVPKGESIMRMMVRGARFYQYIYKKRAAEAALFIKSYSKVFSSPAL